MHLVEMARPLRVQFQGARYHVVNRGNYRSDVFGTVGAAQAFESVLSEGCKRYGWQLFAHVIMRNHFHLAVETPLPNLAEGMHWLQGTFATRFNRYRGERGHLFQGRYYAVTSASTVTPAPNRAGASFSRALLRWADRRCSGVVPGRELHPSQSGAGWHCEWIAGECVSVE